MQKFVLEVLTTCTSEAWIRQNWNQLPQDMILRGVEMLLNRRKYYDAKYQQGQRDGLRH
jgi:hypothetical protein